MTIFDDDDDAEPQLKVVDNYYFEKAKNEFVCFSTLPLKFDENDKVSGKGIYLRRYPADGAPAVYKQVVAWTVALNREQPKISVLSSEGYWIELDLLKPRKIYWKFARSALTTVQMLHFVKRQPRKLMISLSVHLREVFSKFETEEMEDALGKHHHIIKRCAERDPALMRSKILQSFIKDTSGKYFEDILRSLSTKESFIVVAEPLASGGKGNCDTYSDGNIIGDDGDGTEPICAICDEGGELLSCKGRCKRAFHPTIEAGRKSKCVTLGYTAVQVKEMNKFICENCRYEQHQCFKCGELDSSHEPNAKVFQCCKLFCGHFYHPKCAAELLQSHSNGACELENKIAAGMPFPCPVHWCSRPDCKIMEEGTERAMWLAGCRRCPRSYHLDCLPREICFKYGNGRIRAWFLSERNLSKRLIIYCTDHEIDPAMGTPCRDHIKFPALLENKGHGSTESTKFQHSEDYICSPCPLQRKANATKVEEIRERLEKKRRLQHNKEMGSRLSIEGNKNIKRDSTYVLLGSSHKASRGNHCVEF
ncbi:protein ENHANCED DOWNY MILDEW 2-like isoform X2 [Triticum dicoccoides]|uniref:protein ENHANCED DOWNY MILDEW 2-like isoform X2 n=1 Tax=Triticum dicoccoides TaxID=85692 RepID=UPI000E793C24|nr:protein ENHANCED DOWNY MILDEW 2-like isoform X2 [Triticum dicoccoides]XP_037464142.1 protein ENHANCED DOWNY MILDEW 2-like isoform X2 [Triticum dicoccoides]